MTRADFNRFVRSAASRVAVSAMVIVVTNWMFALSASQATDDVLGKTLSGTPFASPAPSLDQTLRSVRVGDKVLSIPRNYLWSAETTPSGALTAPSLKTLYPGFTPRTATNQHCFNDRNDPCFKDIIIFGLLNHPNAPPASNQLHNLRLGPGLIKPQPVPGPCGTTLYEANITLKPGLNAFEYYLKVVNNDSEPTLLRCATEPALHPMCNAEARSAGIPYDYNFERTHLCDWDRIRTGLDTLIITFQNMN